MMQPGKSAADVEATRRNAAAAGFLVEVQPDPETEVYPDHWVPLQVVQSLATQWRIGQSGKFIGLRYEAMPLVFSMLGVPRADRPDVFSVVQRLESEVLTIVRSRAS
jgi:hypothetical protein